MNSIFGTIKQIPSITKEELQHRLNLSIACVIDETEDKKLLRMVLGCHHTDYSYIWAEKNGPVIGRIYSPRNVYTLDAKPKKCAIEVGHFITLHEFGHPLMFKPSMKEVLSQLPSLLFDEDKLKGHKLYYNTKAFSDHAPSTLLGNDYHVAVTTVWHGI